jgi:hypothetical protein
MRETDERFYDQVLEHLRILNANVSDLYEKHGITNSDVTTQKEQIKRLQEDVSDHKDELKELRGGDVDRRVYQGQSSVKWLIVGALLLSMAGAIATGVVNMAMKEKSEVASENR